MMMLVVLQQLLILFAKVVTIATTINTSRTSQCTITSRQFIDVQLNQPIDITFDDVSIVDALAIDGADGVFNLYTIIDDDSAVVGQHHQWQLYRNVNALPQIFYSTSLRAKSNNNTTASSQLRTSLLASAVRLMPLHIAGSRQSSIIFVHISICNYATKATNFNGQQVLVVNPFSAGLVSMYDNELYITFRTLDSDTILFSAIGNQHDVLVVRLVHGRIRVLYDFGSQMPSEVVGGMTIDDGEWHQLLWLHQFDTVYLYIDGVQMSQMHPNGLYRKMDFDTPISIGGSMKNIVSDSSRNLTGCLLMVQLNHVDLLSIAQSSIDSDRPCQTLSVEQITLPTDDTTLLYTIAAAMSAFSIQIRTFSRNAELISLVSNDEYLLAQIHINDDGAIEMLSDSLHISNDQVRHNFDDLTVSDGAWHTIQMDISSSNISLSLDGRRAIWVEGWRLNALIDDLAWIRIGGSGFIGCLRQPLPISMQFRSAPKTTGQVVHDVCQLSNRCYPNPCSNDGICVPIGLGDYRCDCTEHFSGTNCHTPSLPRSCEQHFQFSNRTGRVLIDLDGGHELRPFTVQCSKSTPIDYDSAPLLTTEEVALTELMHKSAGENIQVRGYHEAGGLQYTLDYATGAAEIDRFVAGFDYCQQSMRYECRGGATLMSHDGNMNRPSSWWVGRNGHHAMQWGNAELQSRMCSCATNGSCLNASQMCNCESGRDAIDDGNNTHRSVLPVMQLYLGGTDSHTKSATVHIGALRCQHRSAFASVTFVDRNAHLAGRMQPQSIFDATFDMRTNHPDATLLFIDSSTINDHWLKLFIRDGHLVGEILAGGRVSELQSTVSVSDNEWHVVYWQLSADTMILSVDIIGNNNNRQRSQSISSLFASPSAFDRWRIGSPTGTNNRDGYAGVLRNVHVNGDELSLSAMVHKLGNVDRSIIDGNGGKCVVDKSTTIRCHNSGQCIDYYDSFRCNCSNTSFTGAFCSRDVGVHIANGGRIAFKLFADKLDRCIRFGFQTMSSSIMLAQATGMFTDASLNISLSEHGHLQFAIFDGKQIQTSTDRRRRFDNNEYYDFRACVSAFRLTITINGDDSMKLIASSWQFMEDLNEWIFADQNFTGCYSRIEIGSWFPLKLRPNSSSRLSIINGDRNAIRFDTTCPFQPTVIDDDLLLDSHHEWIDRSISIRPVLKHVETNDRYLIGPLIIVVSILALMVLLFTIVVCYARNRPDGVYKTHEDKLRFTTMSSRSDEPLVMQQNKEYFC